MIEPNVASATWLAPKVLSRSELFGSILRARGWTCATAESCTGGGITALLTSIPGSSDYVQGGIVAYANAAKARLLGVSEQTLLERGAVSSECAAEMARGARAAFGVDLALASTGIAGPGGATARKPVGLVYIAVDSPAGTTVRELHLPGDRLSVISAAIVAALELGLETLGADAPETE